MFHIIRGSRVYFDSNSCRFLKNSFFNKENLENLRIDSDEIRDVYFFEDWGMSKSNADWGLESMLFNERKVISKDMGLLIHTSSTGLSLYGQEIIASFLAETSTIENSIETVVGQKISRYFHGNRVYGISINQDSSFSSSGEDFSSIRKKNPILI